MIKTTIVIPAIVGIAAVLALGTFSPQIQASGPPTCFDLVATVTANPITGSFVGTVGDDVIIGTPGADRIFAGDGNDTICGLDGRDIIVAGDGADQIDPGLGDDIVRSGDGNDTIDLNDDFGDSGDDRVNCGDDEDTVLFADVNDQIKQNCENT
jgi:Ca2+-binding RTX toxin-like protein